MTDRFYTPASDISTGKVGRYLSEGAISYDLAKKKLKRGEHLYALYDELLFRKAICVDDADKYEEVHRRFTEGSILTFDLYALSEEEHQRAE